MLNYKLKATNTICKSIFFKKMLSMVFLIIGFNKNIFLLIIVNFKNFKKLQKKKKLCKIFSERQGAILLHKILFLPDKNFIKKMFHFCEFFVITIFLH